MDYKDFFLTNGLKGVTIKEDFNGDCIKDIVCFIQPKEEFNRFIEPRLLILDTLTLKPILNITYPTATYYGLYEFLANNPDKFEDLALKYMYGLTKNQVANLPPQKQRRIDGEVENKRREIYDNIHDKRIEKEIFGVDVFCDLNNDGIKELIISSKKIFSIYDVKNRKVLLERYFEEFMSENPFTGERGGIKNWHYLSKQLKTDRIVFRRIDDLNNDGINDMIAAGDKGIIVLLSEKGKILSELNFTQSSFFYVPHYMPRDRIKIIDDIDGDGYRELVYQEDFKDVCSDFVIASLKRGVILTRIKDEGTILVNTSDINSDGFKEIFVFYKWYGGRPKLEVFYKDKKKQISRIDEFHKLELLSYADVFPLTPVTIDGKNYIALVRSQEWKHGINILVYDVENEKKIMNYDIEEGSSFFFDENKYLPSIFVNEIRDVNNDNKNELCFIVLSRTNEGRKIKLEVFDLKKGRTILDFNSNLLQCFSYANEIIGFGKNGELYFICLLYTSPSPRD